MTEKELLRKLREMRPRRLEVTDDWGDKVAHLGMRRILSIQTMITVYLILLLLVPFYA